jgi:hypothetical protein
MPMEFILPSLCIATITELSDTGMIEERLAQLVQLEEDRFIARFHQQVQKAREKAWHDRHIKPKKFQVVIWYYSMTTSICNIQGSFACTG